MLFVVVNGEYMKLKDLKKKAKANEVTNVRFIAMACSRIVIEVVFGTNGDKALFRNHHGDVFIANNVASAQDVCLKAGIHKADLVQIIAHDEACFDHSALAAPQIMSMRF